MKASKTTSSTLSWSYLFLSPHPWKHWKKKWNRSALSTTFQPEHVMCTTATPVPNGSKCHMFICNQNDWIVLAPRKNHEKEKSNVHWTWCNKNKMNFKMHVQSQCNCTSQAVMAKCWSHCIQSYSHIGAYIAIRELGRPINPKSRDYKLFQ